MIFCRSKRAAERALERLKPYIEGKLFLKLNEQKTKICRVTDSELKFLGFGFWRFRTEAKVRARPHQKSKAKCRLRLRAITSRSRGQSLDAFRRELRAFVRGWVNYFRISVMSRFVKETDKWLRRRIRQIAKSSLFRGGLQSFRGNLHSNDPNGINFQNLWHSWFFTGYFYVQRRHETSPSGKHRLVHRLIGRSPS